MALCVLGGAAGVGFALEQQAVADAAQKPKSVALFAPYVDATLTPFFQFQDRGANPARHIVLGFVVSDPADGCTPSWGGFYSLSAAADAIDLDRRIARFRQEGGDVSVSFGGQANTELAVGCADVARLAAAYGAVISRYRLTSIDLDVEGSALDDTASFQRRALALASVQKAMARRNRKLSVWLTLPVSPSGLPVTAVQALRALLSGGVTLAGVNVMTMDFGASRDPSMTMETAVEDSLLAASKQVARVYSNAGQRLADVWQRIGATPMIGQNDVADEQFGLDAASQLAAFARAHRLGRISMWSLNRDQPCGPNVVSQQTVMNFCSGIDQQPLAFARIFGTVSTGARLPAVETAKSLDHVVADRRSTSPYPIWENAAGYQGGYKVVWHGYVFQAKWWTQGFAPDIPVAHEWQTPWQVVGPVLPGEHPPVLKRLPSGTYPAWSGTVTYRRGQRVLFDGLAYAAKWWTRGDQPDYQATNLFDTPWRPLFSIPGEPLAPTGAAPPQAYSPPSGP